jgi:EmrB/QacA subfamily drug resistance transporter
MTLRSESQRNNRSAAVAAASLAYFVMLFNTTSVNVALVDIGRDLGASFVELQWVMSGYLAMIAVGFVPGGKLGDQFGHRRVLSIGIGVSVVSSAVIALAPSPPWMIAGRLVQGAATPLMAPASMALVAASFPPQQRARAFAVVMAAFSLGGALGPILGGLTTDTIGWRWLFWFNLPPLALALAFARFGTVNSRNATVGGFDIASLFLFALGFAGVVVYLVQGPDTGFASTWLLGALGAGLACLVVFLVNERRSQRPLLNPALFRSRDAVAAYVASLTMYFGYIGSLFVASIFLGTAMADSATAVGLRLSPLTLSVAIVGYSAGHVATRFGLLRTFRLGNSILAISVLAVSLVTVVLLDSTRLASDLIMIPFALTGCGVGLALTTGTTIAVNEAQGEDAGAASGLISTVRQIGGLLGVSILGALFVALEGSEIRSRIGGAAGEQLLQQIAATGSVHVVPGEHTTALREAASVAFAHTMVVVAVVALAGAVAAFVISAPWRAQASTAP